MARILKGQDAARAINENNLSMIQKLSRAGIEPCLGLIRVGEKNDDIAYEHGIEKRCAGLGIRIEKYVLDAQASTEEVLEVIRRLNKDRNVHGVLLFRPLPRHIDADTVQNALAPAKDVDGMTRASLDGIFTGDAIGFPPCTPAACIKILEHYGIDPCGADVTVIGRSLVIGRPLALMLLGKNATVTICHTKTKNLSQKARNADILVASAGRAGMVTEEFLRSGQTVIDVGINFGPDGKMCGDLDADAADRITDAYTPVPGGVGSVTTSVLAEHVVRAAMRENGIE